MCANLILRRYEDRRRGCIAVHGCGNNNSHLNKDYMEGSSLTIFSVGEVLDILDKEFQDSENDDADSSSDDSVNDDERQCDFIDEEGSQRLVDSNYLSPASMSMFINSLVLQKEIPCCWLIRI